LRLDRDHPRAECAKAAGPVADVGADVEGEIAWPEEVAVSLPERAQAPGLAVVDRERAGEAERPGELARWSAAPSEIGRGH
jgi:hypothetical protein